MINSSLNIKKEKGTLPSPESLANAYVILVSTLANNTVTALSTTNDLILESLGAFKTTMEHTRETTKQIFDITSKAAKTFEQNTS